MLCVFCVVGLVLCGFSFLFFFFFSSRRRHTRWNCDWSSDVCSSDLPHIALELLQSAADVKLVHVPYRGAAPAITDLLGGQVTAMFADAPVLIPHIQSGKLKAIGVAAAARNPMLPDVPTLGEQGYAGTVVDNWYGLLAPAKTPAEIIAKLNQAVRTALTDPVLRDKLVKLGAVPVGSS